MHFLLLGLSYAAPAFVEASPAATPAFQLDELEAPYTWHDLEGALRFDGGYCAFTLESTAEEVVMDLLTLCGLDEAGLSASDITPRLFLTVDASTRLEAVFVTDIGQWFSAGAYQILVESQALESETTEVIE